MHTFHCTQLVILVGGNSEAFPEVRVVWYSELTEQQYIFVEWIHGKSLEYWFKGHFVLLDFAENGKEMKVISNKKWWSLRTETSWNRVTRTELSHEELDWRNESDQGCPIAHDIFKIAFFLPYKCVSDGNSSDTDEIIGQEVGGQDWRGFRR